MDNIYIIPPIWYQKVYLGGKLDIISFTLKSLLIKNPSYLEKSWSI